MRKVVISEALASVRRLQEVLAEMTQEEIDEAIRLEEDSLRRKSVLNLLFQKARSLARAKYQRQP